MTRSPRSRWLVAAAGASSLALVLSACGSDDDTGGSGASASATGDECAPFASYGDFSGKTVNIYSSIQDPELTMYENSFQPFEKCTGAEVKFEGTNEFEAQLKVRVKAGNPPDLAYIPQPGLLANQVATGKVKKPSATVEANVDKGWSPDWKAYGTVDGVFYGAPNSSNVKSLVWYSPSMFKDNGWEIPTTWDQLMTLTETIAASGKVDKPWCVAIGSGDATGWPATDWVEDVMLRLNGPEVYDQWLNHEIPFNDPKVAAALDEVAKVLKNDKYVNGGLGDVKSVATIDWKEGGVPILDGNCAMHRQGIFYTPYFPEGTNIAEDGDVYTFYLPPMTEGTKPVLGGGEFVTAYSDRPEVVALQEWLSSVDYVNNLARVSTGIATANVLADVNLFQGKTKELVATLQDPDAQFRFDASDLMPAAVGQGSFWKGMTEWQTGKSTQDTLDFIEESWPKP